MELQTAPHQPGTPSGSPSVDQLLQHSDWLRKFARALVSDGHEAEDVAQETWIALGQAPVPKGLDGRRWLAGIAKNVVRNRRRSAGRRTTHEGLAAKGRPEIESRSALEDTELLERQRILLSHMESLPEAQRRAMVARFYDGAMPAAIAKAEGVPVPTIHSRIQRGLEKLRADLDGEYGSRRAWAVVFAPLGRQTPQQVAALGAASGAGWLSGLLAWPVLAGVAALLAGGLAWLALKGPASAEVPAAGGLVNQPAPQVAAAADPNAALPALEPLPSPSRMATQAQKQVPLSVVRGASKSPVSGAKVIAMTEAEVQGLVEEHSADLEAIGELSVPAFMTSFGRVQWADDEGRVPICADKRVFVLASTEDAMGLKVMEAGGVDPTIEIERSHRLTVHVLSKEGLPLKTPVPIGAILKTARPKSAYDRMPSFDTAKQVNQDGVVCFQNPWIGTTLDGVEPGQGAAYKYSIETVYIAAPGMGEYEAGARAPGRFKPFQLIPGPSERRLTLPGVGALELELFEDGQLANVEGTVYITFPGKTLGRPNPERYQRPIKGGNALYPMFVTGGRPFEASIHLHTRGTSWTVKGTGPTADSETKKWQVQVPGRAAVTLRFIDPAGDPVPDVHVQLQHSQHIKGRTMGMTGFVAGMTDKTGLARFEIPKDKKMAPPFTVKASRYRAGKLQETLTAVPLTVDDLAVGKDLGEVAIQFVEASTIQGTVVDDSGRPFPDAHISIDARGQFGTSHSTDAKGRFTLNRCLFGDEVLKVSCNDDEFLDEFRTLADLDLTQPIEIQFSRGATFKAQIDCGGVASPQSMLGMRIKRTDLPEGAPEDRVWVKHLGGGEFVGSAVPAGTYSVSLYLSGNVPLTTIEGVQAGPSGEVRDPRVDGLRLLDYVREIDVTWEGSDVGKNRRPQMSVFAAGPKGARRSMHLTMDGSPYLVPTGIPASAVFETGGNRSYRVEDVQALDDTLHIVFSGPQVAVLRIAGSAPNDTPKGTIWILKGVPGTSAEGTSVRLKSDQVKARVCQVSFPTTGKYRLFRKAPDEAMGGNLMAATVAVPTTEVIDVAPPEGDEPPLISLSIGAPLLRD